MSVTNYVLCCYILSYSGPLLSALPLPFPPASTSLLISNMGPEEMTKSEYKEKGGFRASAFVFVLVALENMGFVANMVSLVLYFGYVMYFNISAAANTLTNFMGSTFLLSLLGGFISDTFLSRFTTSLLFGFFEVLGLALVTIQAYSKDLHPTYCGKSSCIKGGMAVMLYASLALLALGSGGVKGALPALGGDQFDQKDPKEAKALARFFNWLLLSTTLGACIGVTGIVWVSTEKDWYWGFFISTVATFIGFVVLALGKPYYRLREPTPSDSPIIRIAQVIAVAIKNRRLALPENPDELFEMNEKEKVFREETISHTNQFRCLDKAAIVTNDSKLTPWTVCTVTQVEEVKILTRMLPILGSTIIMNTCMAQLQTFSVQQGNIMDRHLGKKEVPAPSIPVIPLAFMSILIPIYELFFVPFARKITHHPSGITQLQRIGVGLVLSAISMTVAGVVEVKRRNQALKDITKPISLFWLSFQYGIFGIADMFTLVGLLEFFYKEAPVCMRSLSTSFTWLSLSFGYFLSTLFVNIINSVTKRITPSKQGWLHGLDLNQNNLNLFYWFLAILSSLNFVNYLYWASWYKYTPEEPDPDTKPKDLSTGPPLAKEENTLDGGAKETNDAPSSVQTEDAKQ
ncbi:Proton-dependent oligopeptide transporter family - like 10 [Theobroma cacao]|nr:Proton-dependent oligopeptide transporter family - like 10 [Theobroma cacao]